MIYKRILLPVSGKFQGQRAIKALEHALTLVNGDIVIVHAYPPLPSIVGGEGHVELLNTATAEALKLVAPVVQRVEKEGLPYKVRVIEGAPEDAIVQAAREESCDIIVMFTDGVDRLTDLLLGSVTERVLRATDVPLLAIRR